MSYIFLDRKPDEPSYRKRDTLRKNDSIIFCLKAKSKKN